MHAGTLTDTFTDIDAVAAVCALLIAGAALSFSRKSNSHAAEAIRTSERANSLAVEANQTSEHANSLAAEANQTSEHANNLAVEANQTSERANSLATEANDLSTQHHESDQAFVEARAEIDDNALALGLYQDLTDVDAQNALMRHHDDEPSRRFLVANYDRAAATFQLLEDFNNIKPHLQAILEEQLSIMEKVDPAATKKSAAVINAKRTMDRTTYTWAGTGSFTKHQVLQKLALQLLADHHVTTFKDAAEHLGGAVQQAVRDGSRTFRADRLLTPADRANPHHVRVGEKVGWLRLDGDDWVVTHSLGYPAQDYAARTQVPVINAFIARGFPVEAIDH